MTWELKSFDELTVHELYEILKLRADVFVIEQECIYPDIDDKDIFPGVLHLFSTHDNIISSYMRILPIGCSYDYMPCLGRVTTQAGFRGTGLGHLLLQQAINILDERWPNNICHISAQVHLRKYYEAQNFSVVGEGYLEDDIPHIGMERPAKRTVLNEK